MIACHSREIENILLLLLHHMEYIYIVRSQTYYPENILVYGSREGSLLSYRGFRLFHDRLIRGGDGGGLSTTLSPGLRCGGLESKFGRGPGSLDRRVMG